MSFYVSYCVLFFGFRERLHSSSKIHADDIFVARPVPMVPLPTMLADTTTRLSTALP